MTMEATSAPAPAEAQSSTSIEMVPLTLIKESTSNPRRDYGNGALKELAESIRTHGVLSPILVRPKGAGYQIVCGHRRFRAADLAGLKDIPAMVREMSDLASLEAQLIENCQRADIHPLEEAEGYRQLMATAKYDVARIAERVGRSVAWVYDRVKLLSLTKAAQDLFRSGEIMAGHAVLLARLSPADQKRAIGDEDHSPLFLEERLLFGPDDDDEKESRKPVSVRELQAWIDKHVKLEAAQADPMLFPDTAATVKEALEDSEKIVRITYDDITPDEARGDGQKIILGRSWKRADGKRGSEICDRSVMGMLVIGAGRGEAFRVCVDKKICTVHWAEYQKAAKKRQAEVTKGASTGEGREEIRRRQEREEKARREAEDARWKKAEPAIIAALVVAVKKAPAGAGGPLGKLVLEFCSENLWRVKGASKHVGVGKTAEDLVRHVGFAVLVGDMEGYMEGQSVAEFSKQAKALGVDVPKILAAAAPEPEPKAAAPTKGAATKKPAKKKR